MVSQLREREKERKEGRKEGRKKRRGNKEKMDWRKKKKKS